MDCVNHTGVNATAYCQSCGKALCASCVRNAAGGQILCEPCWTAWHIYQQPFAAPQPGTPSPATAAVLGLIPGVGAMYNGQFIKGLVHVVIFAVLVSAAHVYGIFGIFIAAWVIYRSFEAYHTARARRDGQPLPDPLGLNEVGNWVNPGARGQYPGQPSAGPGAVDPSQTGQGPSTGSYQPPYQQAPYQTPYQGPYTPPPPGFTDPGTPPVPAVPPVPPVGWRRKEPIGAIVLIALVLLFGLGVWLIVRRLRESQGGSK